MDWNPFRKASDYVGNIEDLLSEDARRVARNNRLAVKEIFPLATQINDEIRNCQQKLVIKRIHPEMREGLLDRYSQMLAAAAVLGYELSQRESLQFPATSYIFVEATGVTKEIWSILKKQKWRARRAIGGSPEKYNLMARIFEDNLVKMEERMSEGRIEIDINKTYEDLVLKTA